MQQRSAAHATRREINTTKPLKGIKKLYKKLVEKWPLA